MNAKQAAAAAAVNYIKDGMIVGLGTGSTAYWAIIYLAEKAKSGLTVTTVATSDETERIAKENGLDVKSINDVPYIDINIDGADETDEHNHLIKGGGGALLREKIVAAASKQFFVIVDEAKVVNTLGKFKLPVEVMRFAWNHTQSHLNRLGCNATLRIKNEKPFITDNGNYILDCDFNLITEPALLSQQINAIPGVVENGLFIKMARKLIIGFHNGTTNEIDW